MKTYNNWFGHIWPQLLLILMSILSWGRKTLSAIIFDIFPNWNFYLTSSLEICENWRINPRIRSNPPWSAYRGNVPPNVSSTTNTLPNFPRMALVNPTYINGNVHSFLRWFAQFFCSFVPSLVRTICLFIRFFAGLHNLLVYSFLRWSYIFFIWFLLVCTIRLFIRFFVRSYDLFVYGPSFYYPRAFMFSLIQSVQYKNEQNERNNFSPASWVTFFFFTR